MRFVADENIPVRIIQRLRAAGHTVDAIGELTPRAIDADVLLRAEQSAAVLITQDKDFGELVFRRGQAAHGVLLLRLEGLSLEAKTTATVLAVSELGTRLEGTFAVLAPGHLRLRARSTL